MFTNEFGFTDLWYNPLRYDQNVFTCISKQRLIDCFKQKWFSDIDNSHVLNTLYKYIKPTFGMEYYLEKILCKKTRRFLTRIGVSAHRLRIETGRYGRERLERRKRVCQLCNDLEIEDEYHFILKCCMYKEIRPKCIKKYYYERPSMYKLVDLLLSNNKTILLGLCRFIRLASEKREILSRYNLYS